jgi:hypothetical protein
MSQTWMEDLESEDYESNDEADYEGVDTGEADYEEYGEADYEDYPEDARSDARRARQQRIMLERRRMMLERQRRQRQRQPSLPPRTPLSRPAPPRRAARAPGPNPRQTVRAIRSLDLDTKVGLDGLRRQLAESNRRAGRANWVAVAGVASAEIINQFDALEDHPNVSAAILAAPLLLLSPEKHRGGVEGFLLDPRVIGGATVLGIVVASRFVGASKGVHTITIAAPTQVGPGGSGGSSGSIAAVAFDKNGNVLPNTQFTWNSFPSDQLTVGSGPSAQTTYTIAGEDVTQQAVIITAQYGGVTGTVSLDVVPS